MFYPSSNFAKNGLWIVSIPGPHEGRGQNTNPECQLESRVSTGITSGDESAQRATSDAIDTSDPVLDGTSLLRGGVLVIH